MSDAIEGEIVNRDTPVNLTKHPEDVVQLLEAAFNNAFNITEACQYAGISRETYYTWLADDDIFSTRMSIAQAAPNKKAKEIVMTAISKGDPQLALRYLTLRDPDFKPKAEVTNTPELVETRRKIREFLNDTNDGAYDDTSSQSSTATGEEVRGEVAGAPTDIS